MKDAVPEEELMIRALICKLLFNFRLYILDACAIYFYILLHAAYISLSTIIFLFY
jgi:hypothetical protein